MEEMLLKESISKYESIHPELVIALTPIGIGGMKTVLKAYDTEREIDLVIKVILLTGENSEKRTIREINILKSLDSPYFPKVLDTYLLEISDKKIFISSEELIKGQTLKKYCENTHSLESKVKIGKELLQALDVVHNRRLVHRDIKPENIMIDEQGNVVLLDFGIARDLNETSITSDLAMFGPMTIGYAAPEQIANKKKLISPRTDLFSWAVVMTEMLTGKNPLTYGEKSRERVIQKTLKLDSSTLSLVDTPIALATIIKKNLSPKLHLRSKSAEELIDIIESEGY